MLERHVAHVATLLQHLWIAELSGIITRDGVERAGPPH